MSYTYERDTVESVIDCVFDDEWAVLASKDDQVGSPGGLPSDGMGAVVMAADVRKAWSRLSDFDQDILACRYRYGLGLDAIAVLAGFTSVQKAADELESAIGLLVDLTNGA